ncbi:Fanconi anemia core complex-associated protein 24-like [Acropora muricata]|uniref:Fanconi anemia core complex-associated protein 24-like n=1 Tax=Acropora muricata TaxID=159855 RepID=UPI0034E4A10C
MGTIDYAEITRGNMVPTSRSFRTNHSSHNQASFRKVVLAEKTPPSSQYFLSLQKFVVIERDLVLLPVANSDEVGKILAQMVFLERKPQNNPYRIKMKPTPIDKALLTTLQAVPGLGQKKALSLLTQYGSIEQISKASTAFLSTVVGKANAQQVKDFFPTSNSWRQAEEHTVLRKIRLNLAQ